MPVALGVLEMKVAVLLEMVEGTRPVGALEPEPLEPLSPELLEPELEPEPELELSELSSEELSALPVVPPVEEEDEDELEDVAIALVLPEAEDDEDLEELQSHVRATNKRRYIKGRELTPCRKKDQKQQWCSIASRRCRNLGLA